MNQFINLFEDDAKALPPSITPEKVSSWKSEFLEICRNIPDRVTWENAGILKDALRKVVDKHDAYCSLLYTWEEREKKSYASILRKAWWGFTSELRRIEHVLESPSRKKARDIDATIAELNIRHPDTDWKDYFQKRPEPTQSELDVVSLIELKKRLVTLKRSAAAKARVLWKEFDWFISSTPTGGPDLDAIKEEVLQLNGITFILIGKSGSAKDMEIVRRLPEWSAYYAERIAKVAPVLLRCPLPVKLHFREGTCECGGSAAACYEGRSVSFTPTGLLFNKSNKEFCHVLAHEMGHHLYHIMGKDRNKFWNGGIKGDVVELRVGDILAKRLPDEGPNDFEKRIKKEDPLLYLQIESLYYGNPSLEVWSIYSLVKRSEEGKISGDTILYVPGSPITSYAAKNSDESFCEALGLLVAYGVGAVQPKIRHLLSTILPSALGESK